MAANNIVATILKKQADKEQDNIVARILKKQKDKRPAQAAVPR